LVVGVELIDHSIDGGYDMLFSLQQGLVVGIVRMNFS
jgi:hypothetical protein